MSNILFSIFGISNAYAAAPAAGQGGGSLLSFLPMLAILFVFMYFMIIRPQSKRVKEHRNVVSNLKKGDEVVTIGGILGRIEKITDNFILLSIADGINVSVQRNSVSSCLPKGTMKTVEG